MKRLDVFADFDWLKEPRLIGKLSYESLHGSSNYGFCYNDEWLKDYGGLFLSDDEQLYRSAIHGFRQGYFRMFF